MTLRQKIENILNQAAGAFITPAPGGGTTALREIVLDEIMNEISKDVYGRPLQGMK